MLLQERWPTQDSNLESPAPEADALSIRPTGQVLIDLVELLFMHLQCDYVCIMNCAALLLAEHVSYHRSIALG